MAPDELEIFRDLLSSFKQEIHNDLKQVTDQIKDLTKKIDNFQQDSNKLSLEIGIIQEKQKTLKENLNKNFEQHDNFYKRLNTIEKLPDVSKKAEDNENEIIKIKTTAWTAYTIIAIILALLGILSKLNIL